MIMKSNDHLCHLWFLRLLTVAVALHLVHTVANAQASVVDVRVAGVHGRAVISGHAHSQYSLVPGVVVNPGDEIDTSSGGRVTLELSDGSMLIVQPGSRVVLQDYRDASSLRELLHIAVGHVRIRINRLGGRPNPYRINSPTASIAVRGTEFSVAVNAAGDTEVVVYEGIVEVSSLRNPGRRVLVHPGRGVIVRPNEDVLFFTPGSDNEIGSRRNGRKAPDEDNNSTAGDEFTTSPGDSNSLHTAAGVYERYFDNIVESGELPLPSRFTAFADSYFDSLDNPSYATEFRTTEGRIFLVPSIGGTGDKDGARELLSFGDRRLLDYSYSPQASFFVPINKFGLVLGGRVAFSRDGFQSLSIDDDVRLMGPRFTVGTLGTRTVDGSTRNRLLAASFVAARRFGSDGRSSIGIGVDHLRSNGSLSSTTTQTDDSGRSSLELADTGSVANRTRFSIGLTHDFAGGSKLGIFYRYGSLSAEDRDRSRTLDGLKRLLNRTSTTARTSEFGFRFRDSFTRRLFYGVEGSYFIADTNGRTRRARVVDSNESGDTTRATIGGGLGYIFNPRTIFSFDMSGGWARVSDARRERATGNLLEDETKRALFFSLHAAMQADVWRRMFVSGSMLSISQFERSDLMLYPDRFGRRVDRDGIFEPNGRSHDRFTDYFSNFGVGWRFTPNFLAEYIFSTDFGQTSPRHTLLFRYTFGSGDR
jgi:FecR protein